MKQNTAGTLWLIVGAALFYFLFNAIAAAQGWPFELPGVKFEKFDRYAVALVATPIGLLALAVLLSLGAEHARRSGSNRIHERLPVPFKLGDSDSVSLHVLQIAAFVVLPVIALVCLYVKYLGGQFCHLAEGAKGCGVGGYRRVGENGDHFAYVAWRLAFKPREFIYQGNVDYWPFWEPIGISLLWLVFAAALTWFAACVLRGRTMW